jgi:hypothetical protein
MRLSEAIRLGAMTSPQGFGVDSVNLDRDAPKCAWGAAIEAAGLPSQRAAGGVSLRGEPPIGLVVTIPDEWLRIANQWTHCPECNTFRGYVAYLIPHLNDEHRWTREQIAAWIETLEAKEAEAEAVMQDAHA